MRRLGRALLLALLVALGAVGLPGRAGAQEDEVTPLLTALQRAWAEGDAAGVAALFAPEAVIRTQPVDAKGTGVYLGASGPASLDRGVRALLGGATPDATGTPPSGPETVLLRTTYGATRIDVASRQTAALVVDGAPAVVVRWTYARAGTAPGSAGGALPTETGTDEVVIRGGRIAAYTRAPDPASLQARDRALARAVAAQRTAPSPGGDPPPTPARASPGAGPWLLAAGLALTGALLLARAYRNVPLTRF